MQAWLLDRMDLACLAVYILEIPLKCIALGVVRLGGRLVACWGGARARVEGLVVGST